MPDDDEKEEAFKRSQLDQGKPYFPLNRGSTVSRAIRTIQETGNKILAPINPALLRFGAKLGLNEDPELKAIRERERLIQLQIDYMKRREEEQRLQDLANQGVPSPPADYEF